MEMIQAVILLFIVDLVAVRANNVITADPEAIPPNHQKVHNLLLNPDQHSWCDLKHIRQIVTHAHCTSKEMENFVCVGTCFSYSVPQTDPETPGDGSLDYCDSCQASESHWTTVVLDCEFDDYKYQVEKNIQMITNCSCSPCHPSKRMPVDNEVTSYPDHRISDLIYKIIPESHKFKENVDAIEIKENGGLMVDLTDELRYTQVSLGDLKKEFNLNDKQEKLLHGKHLVKDKASFIDNEDGQSDRGYISH